MLFQYIVDALYLSSTFLVIFDQSKGFALNVLYKFSLSYSQGR